MNSKEILERNKTTTPADEGIAHLENRARAFATSFILVFTFALSLFHAYKGIPWYGVLSISTLYAASESFHKFRFSKQKGFLFSGIVSALFTIWFLASFLMQTC